MDDSKFDQHIRNKVARYRDEGIDPGALERLHQRLEGVSYDLPWYKSVKNLTWIAASVVLISLLNFSLYSYIHRSDNKKLLDQLAQLKSDQKELYELQNQVNNRGDQLIDTIYVYKEKAVAETSPRRLETLLASLSAEELNDLVRKHGPQQHVQETGNVEDEEKLYIAGLEDAPGEVKSFLRSTSLFVFDKGKRVQVTVDNLPYEEHPVKLGKKGYYMAANNWQPFYDIGVDPDDKDEVSTANEEKKVKDAVLPARILRVLEKNEMDGVGFRWGPEVQLFGQNYDLGTGELQPGLGVLAELVLSPSLRLESGFQYTKLDYGLNDSQISNVNESHLEAFPALNMEIGELNEIHVSSDVIGTPLNLKYFHPVSRKKKIFASIGYTPMLFISQNFEYSYLSDLNNDIEEDDFSTSLESRKREDDPGMYAGTFNASLGMESQLKTDLFLQAALFYQKGIDETGKEGRELQLFGIRSSLWFKVR